MKHALALTFLSSMTCLVAWNAEAAPAAAPEAHHKHHHHGVKSTAKAAPHAAAKPSAKNAPKKTDHHAPKRVAKVEVNAKVAGHPVLSGTTKTDIDLPLNSKPTAGHKPAVVSKAHPAPSAKAPAKVEPHAAVVKKHGPERSYFLAADPHVPLAFVDGNAIHSVGTPGKNCGTASRWAKPKSRWNALDAWGQVTGSLQGNGSDFYDATRCREVFFKGKEGTEPHAVFVSADSSFRPSPKVEWTPDEAEHKEFERFTSTLTALWINQKPFGKPLPLTRRVMFFQVPASEGKNAHRPTRWAVMGGPLLLVAYLGDKDHWKVATVQTPLGLADSYHPVGVFDMNGDKIPEIIYHANSGASFGDSVLSLDPDTMTWSEAAVSPGGATL